MLLLVPKSDAKLPDGVGSLVTPSNGAVPGAVWAADNEAFVGFDEGKFRRMLDRVAQYEGCLFTVAPDAVGDHVETLRLWRVWRGQLSGPVAFVLQDGCREVPDDADAVFVGGSTEWKLSNNARRLVDTFSGWSHMGRVNSVRRLRVAKSWGVDSVDGSGMARFPDAMLPRMIDAAAAAPQLALL